MIKPFVAAVLLFLMSIVLAALVFFFGARAGFGTPSEKITVWASLTVVAAFLFFLPVAVRALWINWTGSLFNRRLKPNEMADPNAESTRLIGAAYRWEQLKQFHQLTGQYKDHRKPWILVVGSNELLERTFPGIKENLWIESHHAFWLDAQAVEPAGGWGTLRGGGKRPAEGVVCLSAEKDQAYRFGEQLKTLFSKLNWLLPVNRIYISQSEDYQEKTAVSHVLNLGSSKEKVGVGLGAFAQELKALGTVAIEHEVNHRYIANLSKTLEANNSQLAEAIAADKKILGKLDSIRHVSFIAANNQEVLPALIFKACDVQHVFGKGAKIKWTQSDRVYLGLSALALMFSCLFAYTANHSHQHMLRFQSNLTQLQDASVGADAGGKMVKLRALQNEIMSMEKEDAEIGTRLVRIVGYDHSKLLLDKAYEQYAQSAQQIIFQPAINQFVGRLNQLNSLSVQELAVISDEGTQYYNTLKAYLMLTEHTEKIESAFLSEQMLLALEQQGIKMPQAQAKEVISFFIRQFSKNANWAGQADASLVENSRLALVGWIGEHQAEERVYRRIIDTAKTKYPAVTLARLLNRDIKGLWNVSKELPGIYTVRAWEEYIKHEFAKVAKNKHNDDWVLADSAQQAPMNEAVIANLKNRYFNEYAAAWLNVLNSITWIPRTKTLDAVNQLHTYADPQRSPLIGLFEAIKANGMLDGKQVVLNTEITHQTTGVVTTQVSSNTRHIANMELEKQNDNMAESQGQVSKYIEGPLQDEFETLLQLVDPNINPKSDLSLQRYLEKITSTKQKLIQIAGASDSGAASRIAMQSVFNGNDNEFTDGLQYARLIEASIGGGWLPFAHNVFVLPLHTSWDGITVSAKQNINTMWSKSLSLPLNTDLGGRYPFSPSEIEVSLPMLAKYLEPEHGLLEQFIKTQLGGVLTKQGSQWVENPGQNLRVNKNFIGQINKISAVANDLFVGGEAGYTFELKPAATPGITRFNLSLDGQSMDYFNQEAEWKSFKWPGDMANAGMRITWEADEAGLRKTREYNGRFGFIRMLEAARVTPVDRSTYLIESGIAQDKALRFYMRTNAGKGPLGILDLRNIQLPLQIFEVK